MPKILKIKRFILSIAPALFLFSCGADTTKEALLLDTLYMPRHATHFLILKGEQEVVLRVKNPWQGASGIEKDYPIGEDWNRVVCMSSSHASFLDALSLTDRVVGVSAAAYYFNEKFAALPDVGYDNNINVELIASLQPDVITAYELAGENSTTIEKLSSLGVNPIYVADYLEDTPLARAEWVVAFGALSGNVERGVAVFEKVERRYSTLRDSLSTLGLSPKKVMLNSPYKGVWYLPSDDSFLVRLIGDAGGQYVAAGVEGNVSRAVSTEVAYAELLEADVWLNPSANINSISKLRGESPLLKDIDMPVYNTTRRSTPDGGSDFWESGVVRPDIILSDVVEILHPGTLKGYELYYYEKLK